MRGQATNRGNRRGQGPVCDACAAAETPDRLSLSNAALEDRHRHGTELATTNAPAADQSLSHAETSTTMAIEIAPTSGKSSAMAMGRAGSAMRR